MNPIQYILTMSISLTQPIHPASPARFHPMIIRPATEADIQPICDLVNGFAAQNLMLNRTPEQVRRASRDALPGSAVPQDGG